MSGLFTEFMVSIAMMANVVFEMASVIVPLYVVTKTSLFALTYIIDVLRFIRA